MDPLGSIGLSHLDGGITMGGFVVNMNVVFEQFVCRSLTTAFAKFGGRCKSQRRSHLDHAQQVEIQAFCGYAMAQLSLSSTPSTGRHDWWRRLLCFACWRDGDAVET